MKFRAIEYANFGTLSVPGPVELSSQLNIVRATNQAGKTTLFKLLEWTLYGVPPRGRNRNLSELEAWSPWSGARPGAALLIETESEEFPRLIRVEVQFDRFQLAVTDATTLQDITARFEVRSNGVWDLGQQLTGLSREAYLASLMAEQGAMELLFNDDEMRKLLTADLAGLVEDPDRASMDAAIRSLEQPKFRMRGVGDSEVLLRSLQKRAADAYSNARSERVALEERYRELEQALLEREEAESRQAESLAELELLLRQMEEYHLAAAQWRYRRIDQLTQETQYWSGRMSEEPALRNFPRDLRQTVERWQGESAVLSRELEGDRARLNHEKRNLAQVEEFLRSREGLSRYVASLKEVEYHRSLVTDARERFLQGEEKVANRAGSSEPESRQQFEELDSFIRPHRTYIPRMLGVIEDRGAIAERIKVLAARRDELDNIARAAQSSSVWVGLLLIVLGALFLAWNALPQITENILPGAVKLAFYGYIGGALLVFLGALLLISGSARRRVALRAESELAADVRPKLAELMNEEADVKRVQLQLQREHEISDDVWNALAVRIPRYMLLKLKHEDYSEALAERESAQQQMNEHWRRIRGHFLDLPKELDLEWLGTRIAEVEDFRDKQSERSQLGVRVMELEREINHKDARVRDMQKNLATQLEPLGLYELALSDPQAALQKMEHMAQQASQLEEVERQYRSAIDMAQGLRLNRDEYLRQIGALDEQRRARVESLITTEDRYGEIMLSLHDMDNRRAKLEYLTARAGADVSRLRESLARDEAALLALPEAQQREKEAQDNLKATDRWQRAIELLSATLTEVQQNLTSNLAPQINEQFRQVLGHAPVMNVEDAVLGPDLELRLRIKGAPVGLAQDQLLARLSTGARRQLALALRVAVARALGGSIRPPIMLDEPLSELDDERAADCLRYLGRLSDNNQIIISTCHFAQYRWLIEQTSIPVHVLELPQGLLQPSC